MGLLSLSPPTTSFHVSRYRNRQIDGYDGWIDDWMDGWIYRYDG